MPAGMVSGLQRSMSLLTVLTDFATIRLLWSWCRRGLHDWKQSRCPAPAGKSGRAGTRVRGVFGPATVSSVPAAIGTGRAEGRLRSPSTSCSRPWSRARKPPRVAAHRPKTATRWALATRTTILAKRVPEHVPIGRSKGNTFSSEGLTPFARDRAAHLF